MPDSFIELKSAVEYISDGNNTVVVDDINMPSIMVKVSKGYSRDLLQGAVLKSTASRNAITQIIDRVHPAFVVNNQEIDTVYVSKYPNTIINNRPYSLPLRFPVTTAISTNTQTVVNYCRNKGTGWGLMPNALWAYIALLTKKLRVTIGGNNKYGYNYQFLSESGFAQSDSTTMFGSGGVHWNHDNTLNGITDLHGNLPELVSDLRINAGEIQVIPYADSILSATDISDSSSAWRAIGYPSDTVSSAFTSITSGSESTFLNAKTARYTYENSALKFDMGDNTFTRKTTSSGNTQFELIENISSGVTPQECYELLICPQAEVSYDNDIVSGVRTSTGYIEVAQRGGSYRDSAGAGIFNINFAKSNNLSVRQFRSVYYPLS